jgi:hypothetical protein
MNRHRQPTNNHNSRIARLLDAAQRRFRRARPGSVLVMVVALLVMLALIGTAAMSTARLDRMSSVQHVKNTQLDIMAESVKNMAIADVIADLFSNGKYRDVATDQTTYDHYDYPGSDPQSDDSDTNTIRAADGVLNKSFDAWLGSRLPELVATGAGSAPGWRFTSNTPLRLGNGYQVDAPDQGTAGTIFAPKVSYVPTYLNVNGTDQPALTAYTGGAKVNNPWGVKSTFLAGDADGDGVADSLYFKLGTIGSITYYGCYRIIDNNSAINVNTAMVRDGDFIGDGNNPPKRVGNDGFFTTNVGMAEFLSDYVSNPGFKTLYDVSPEFTNTLNRKMPTVPSGLAGGNGSPVDEKNNAISSFSYRTVGDAVYMGLARRPDYPGHTIKANPEQFFGNGTRPYGLGDAFALAYRFCLSNSGSSYSPLENDILNSAVKNVAVASVPYYPAAQNQAGYDAAINRWYQNFDYNNSTVKRPVRSVFVTFNPTSNAAPSHAAAGQALYPGMSLTPQLPIKVSLNTAPYVDLWRGFYEVMCTDGITTGLGVNLNDATQNDKDALSEDKADPYYGSHFKAGNYKNTLGELHPGRMFRSPLRGDGSTVLAPRQVMALRAAIASWNTVALRNGIARSGSLNVAQKQVPLVDASGRPEFQATIYHGAPQPFITEIYAQTDINTVVGTTNPADPINLFKDKKNPRGFVAIEIYNPYDIAIDLTGWRIGRIDRSKFPNLKVDFLVDSKDNTSTAEFVRFDPAKAPDPSGKDTDAIPVTSIGPGQRLVIHNYRPKAEDSDMEWAHYPPPNAAPLLDATKWDTLWVQVKQLPSILGKQGTLNHGYELVLLRPGAGNKGDLFDMVPCDSYDFTGMNVPSTEGLAADNWHYCRTNDDADQKRWTFVYPGRYDGSLPSSRLQGTEHQTWNPVPGPTNPTPQLEPINLNIRLTLPDPNSTRNLAGTYTNPDDPYDFPIQYFATDTPGPGVSPSLQFPFGGFARAGDVMQVPFIGAYAIRKLNPADGTLADTSGQTLAELNSVTMDAVFAEDTDPSDDDVEDIGRFAPVVSQPNALPGAAHAVNDLDFSSNKAGYASTSAPRYNYHWTARLFDFFTTVNNPNDDYLPNMDPLNVSGTATQAVPNGPKVTSSAQANKGNEDQTPVEGLINLNTASAKVLSAVPFLPPSNLIAGSPPTYDSDFNTIIARSITDYRDVNDPATGKAHGPFTSLFELDRVPIYDYTKSAPYPLICYYRDVWNIATGGPRDADDDDGDFTPINNGSPKLDGVRDFEDRYLAVNRVSNLLTLRSDTFTAYILVQGWRNAGSVNPILEGQRRLAVIIDRSRITPVKKTPAVYNVPTAN